MEKDIKIIVEGVPNMRIDRDSLTIGGISIKSKDITQNGTRVWEPKASESLFKMVNGTKSFLDHGNPMTGSSVKDLLGEFKNVRKDGVVIRADLHLLKASQGKDLVLEVAEKFPEMAGFSVNCRGVFSEEADAEGREHVVDIVKLRSIDFVSTPSSNIGIFEAKDRETELTELLAENEELKKDLKVQESLVKHYRKRLEDMKEKDVPDKKSITKAEFWKQLDEHL